MNARKALKVARELWGPKGFVLERRGRFSVGRVRRWPQFEVAGEGKSWDEAFTAAREKWAAFQETQNGGCTDDSSADDSRDPGPAAP